MRVYLILLIAAAAVCLGGYIASGRWRNAQKANPAQSGPQVTAELIAGTDAIVPGQEFLVGVHFRIAPGWHIYHKDPGDAGLPTSVELNLPSGFVVGQVLYPKPVQFKQPGDIVGYGYKDEVMLLVPVLPPPDLTPGQNITLQANAQWLACLEICILGEQQSEQVLPVASNAKNFRKELFEKWMQQVPSASEVRAEGAVFSCSPRNEGDFYECKSDEAVARCDSHAAPGGLRSEERRIRKG